jgi:hypothetical protein
MIFRSASEDFSRCETRDGRRGRAEYCYLVKVLGISRRAVEMGIIPSMKGGKIRGNIQGNGTVEGDEVPDTICHATRLYVTFPTVLSSGVCSARRVVWQSHSSDKEFDERCAPIKDETSVH